MNKQEQADALGKRLALLLAAAPWTEEQKDAWAALVPKMTFEQLGRFADLLENSLYAEDSTMKDLEKNLDAVQGKYQAAEQAINSRTHSGLDDLEKQLAE